MLLGLLGRTDAVHSFLGGGLVQNLAADQTSLMHRLAARNGEEPRRTDLQQRLKGQGIRGLYGMSKEELMKTARDRQLL